MNASQEGMLAVELFLNENYLFRTNVLNKKVEFTERPAEGKEPCWKALTAKAQNSMVIRAKREQICEKGSPKTDIMEYVNSDEIDVYNPIADFMEQLPQWDGENHVAALFNRLPGVGSEQLGFLAIWLRSVVAHWLQMDTLHGNECVPTLIGPQGCGKTTFVQRMLPPHLRVYYLDQEAIRPSQQASLKQTLSKTVVNGRPIYGSTQEDRPRFASFVATTNNPHPLTDVTGSRRFICLTIPDGKYIDNTGEIDYPQLYAQVLYELKEQKSPYWFNNEEVARIQQLIISVCFRKPEQGELPRSMNCNQLMEVIAKEYPGVKNTHTTKVHLGKAMHTLGFDSTDRGHVTHYKVIPLKAV